MFFEYPKLLFLLIIPLLLVLRYLWIELKERRPHLRVSTAAPWKAGGRSVLEVIRHLPFAEAVEPFLRLQVGVQGELMLAVDVGFLHLRELRIVLQGAELVDLVIRLRRLPGKLVAGHINDLQTLVMELLIHLFQRLILRRESAARRRIDYDDDLSFSTL